MLCESLWMRSECVAFCAEVLAGDVPVSALAGAGRLDVGGRLARLPAAGHDERAGYGGALGTMDVLGVAEPQLAQLLAGEPLLAAGDVELDKHLARGRDVEDLFAAAVLDPLHAGLAVLLDQRYPVALADVAVDAGHQDFQIAEFAALGAEVLRAGVQTVGLIIGRSLVRVQAGPSRCPDSRGSTGVATRPWQPLPLRRGLPGRRCVSFDRLGISVATGR